MVKKIAVDIEQVVWECPDCFNIDVVCDYKKDLDDRGVATSSSYPISVYNRYVNANLPKAFDSTVKREFPAEQKKRNLFEEDEFLNSAYPEPKLRSME